MSIIRKYHNHKLQTNPRYREEGCFWKEKNSKTFPRNAFTAEQGWILAKMENVVKNSLTVISNDTGFKLFTLNQVIDEVNC